MKNFSLSPRLNAVLDFLSASGNCQTLADIGTDHAHLPIEACRANLCRTAIACDIVPGPLKMAEQNIQAAEFSQRIQTRLGNGLAPLAENEADHIVIAGMGGMRIIEILTAEPEKARHARLILQPQHDMEELRRFLHANTFEITGETLVREGSRFYVVIAAQVSQTAQPYTNAEYFLGRFDSKSQNAEIFDYFSQKRDAIMGYIASLNNNAARKQAKQRIKWLEDIINAHSTMDN